MKIPDHILHDLIPSELLDSKGNIVISQKLIDDFNTQTSVNYSEAIYELYRPIWKNPCISPQVLKFLIRSCLHTYNYMYRSGTESKQGGYINLIDDTPMWVTHLLIHANIHTDGDYVHLDDKRPFGNKNIYNDLTNTGETGTSEELLYVIFSYMNDKIRNFKPFIGTYTYIIKPPTNSHKHLGENELYSLDAHLKPLIPFDTTSQLKLARIGFVVLGVFLSIGLLYFWFRTIDGSYWYLCLLEGALGFLTYYGFKEFNQRYHSTKKIIKQLTTL